MKSDIFHRDEGRMIPENQSLFNDQLLEEIDKGFHLLEKDDCYIAEIPANGLEKNDFNINVADGVLYVTAEHRDEVINEDNDCYEESKVFSSFQQSFLLPKDAKEDQISANMVDDVLHITIGKIGSGHHVRQIPVEEPSRFSDDTHPEQKSKKPDSESFFEKITRKIKSFFS
jgi:HSP20 family molecular chaperone IbpA